MKLNSIRFKASILYTSILCIILVAFSASLFYVTHQILYRDLDEILTLKATKIADILSSYEDLKKKSPPPNALLNKLFGIDYRMRMIIDDLWRSDVRALGLKKDYTLVLNNNGRAIIKSGNVNKNIATLFQSQLPFQLTNRFFKDVKGKQHRLRAINFPFSYKGKYIFVIQVATPLDSVTKLLTKLLYFLGASILFILGLTSFLGSFFARRILKPVLNITNIADDISHTDLNLRIEETEVDDEMKHLIHSFNAMIDRLEKSFEHINEFSSHVAHELKTPIAIIKGEIELALSEPRDIAEYKRVMNVSLEEIDRLVKIIKDLLLLARLDYNPEVFEFETLNLVKFLEDVFAHSKILAIEKKIDIELDVPPEPEMIEGDQTHLKRLFFNLINNAIKFTPRGGRIRISLTVLDKTAHVAISDNGIGIAQKDLMYIFNKFFRAHQYDPHSPPGSGLGLNIAQSIARAHNGTIEVQSGSSKGATFIVSLPLA
ncbi:MAG: ATP-binding protein [Dissulfuribacterales bacterium]